MTVITTIPSTSPPSTSSRLTAIFSSCGLVRFVDEKHFNVCTALAGSGPAFVAMMVDALADGAVLMGLPRAEAVEMAAQSMFLLVSFACLRSLPCQQLCCTSKSTEAMG